MNTTATDELDGVGEADLAERKRLRDEQKAASTAAQRAAWARQREACDPVTSNRTAEPGICSRLAHLFRQS